MTRLLIAGDCHGDTPWVQQLVATATANMCERIVVCGDFGYWVHYADGRQFLADVDAAVAAAGLAPLVFVDGNHEYHSTHPAKPPHKRFGLQELPPAESGFVELTGHVHYAPRGQRWRWQGVSFGALGGAASTDVERRKPYRDLWPEEMVRAADVDRLGAASLDVLVCHDAPGTHPVAGHPERGGDPRTDRNRARITVAVAATRPQVVLHGHWHVRYDTTLAHPGGHARVVGLGANVDIDGEPVGAGGIVDAAVVLELPSLQVSPPLRCS